MSFLTSDPQAAGHDIFKESSIQQHSLGERMVAPDGRVFRYAKMGAVAGVAGNLYQAPVEITNHQNLAPTANVAIGDTSFTVTLGATAVTANQYAGGWVIITTSTGLGHQYKIKSHPAAALSATVLLTLEDPVRVAFVSATSKVDMVLNPYNGVLVNPTTATSAVVGAVTFVVTAGYYFWLQVRGVAALLADGALAVGTAVSASNAVAGAVEALAGIQQPVGLAVTGVADTQFGAVDLKLE